MSQAPSFTSTEEAGWPEQKTCREAARHLLPRKRWRAALVDGFRGRPMRSLGLRSSQRIREGGQSSQAVNNALRPSAIVGWAIIPSRRAV